MSIPETIHNSNTSSHVVFAIKDELTNRWYFTYTVYEGEDALYTVTTSQLDLFVACRIAQQAEFGVDTDLAAGKLSLPDMGDWSVEYFED